MLVTVRVGSKGASADKVYVTGVLQIDSITPNTGSTEGGTIVRIRGKGFAMDNQTLATNYISIGYFPAAPCRILSASYDLIVCQTEPAGRMHMGASAGKLNALELDSGGTYARCNIPELEVSYVVVVDDIRDFEACDAETDPDDCPPSVPVLQVTLDNIPGVVGGPDNCVFYYTEYATPEITDIGGMPDAENLVTINGNRLGDSLASVFLWEFTGTGAQQRWLNFYSEVSCLRTVRSRNVMVIVGRGPYAVR